MKRSIQLVPKHKRLMSRFGERLKLARLRRRLSAELVAERGIPRSEIEQMRVAFEL